MARVNRWADLGALKMLPLDESIEFPVELSAHYGKSLFISQRGALALILSRIGGMCLIQGTPVSLDAKRKGSKPGLSQQGYEVWQRNSARTGMHDLAYRVLS